MNRFVFGLPRRIQLFNLFSQANAGSRNRAFTTGTNLQAENKGKNPGDPDYIDHLLEQVKPKLPPPKNDERSYVGDPALVYLGYRTTLNKLKERHKKQS